MLKTSTGESGLRLPARNPPPSRKSGGQVYQRCIPTVQDRGALRFRWISPGRRLAGRSGEHRHFWENFLYSPFSTLAECVIADLTRPVFNHLVWIRSSHPSGSRLWELSSAGSDLPPLAIFIAPENYRYHAASKAIGSQILWLSLFRGPTLVWLTAWAYHRITAPPSCRYVAGRDSGQIGPCGFKPTRDQAHCPIPAVKLPSQANALVISNAT